MMMSALLAVSAWIVALPATIGALVVVAVAKGVVAAGDAAVAALIVAAVAAIAAGAVVAVVTAGKPRSAPVAPPYRPRSVSATRSASAFFRYTIKMLPPARCGVSGCSIRCRIAIVRGGFPRRTRRPVEP